MTVLFIALGTVGYLLAGSALLRFFVKRGVLTVEHDAAYGLVLLLWPLIILVGLYLLFNAVVYAILTY